MCNKNYINNTSLPLFSVNVPLNSSFCIEIDLCLNETDSVNNKSGTRHQINMCSFTNQNNVMSSSFATAYGVCLGGQTQPILSPVISFVGTVATFSFLANVTSFTPTSMVLFYEIKPFGNCLVNFL